MSLSFGSKKTTQTQKSQTDPWAPTQGYLKDFLARLNTAGSAPTGPTLAQTDAANQIMANAGVASGMAPQANAVAADQFNAKSYAPVVGDAYTALSSQLTPYANGEALDIGSNPYINDLLKTVREDTSNNVNSMWGAAGRDFSPGHAMALSRGIASAEAPILLNQYNTERAAQSDAAKALFEAGGNTATTSQNLDQSALATRAGGINTASQAADLANLGPNATLQLTEQLKQLPFDELGWISQYLFPAAQLGQQSQGTGTAKTNSLGFGISATDIGKILSAFAV
jgi:hypothetical protein